MAWHQSDMSTSAIVLDVVTLLLETLAAFAPGHPADVGIWIRVPLILPRTAAMALQVLFTMERQSLGLVLV